MYFDNNNNNLLMIQTIISRARPESNEEYRYNEAKKADK